MGIQAKRVPKRSQMGQKGSKIDKKGVFSAAILGKGGQKGSKMGGSAMLLEGI